MRPEIDERDRPRVSFVSLWRPALLFAASRALVLLAFVVAGAAHRGLGLHTAINAWDSGYYTEIADHGYPTFVAHGPSVLAFFPGFPLAIRGIEEVLRVDSYAAGLIVVHLCGLAATCGVWLLTRELSDVEAADRATALFAFAPGTFVLSFLYSEALFVLCAVATCWALIRRRWILAGLVGALGTATRADGIALVLAAACAAFVAPRTRNNRHALECVALVASGFVAFQLFLWVRTGDLFAFFETQSRGWHHGFGTAGTGRLDDVRSVWRTVFDGRPADWNHIVPLVGLALFIAMFVVLVRWRPPLELVGFTAGLAFLALTSVQVGFRPRLLMVAFPLSMALGVKLRRGPWFAVALATSAALLVMLAIISVATVYITP